MEYDTVINRIKALADPEAVKGMARYGINPNNNFGVSITELRKIAKETGKDHELAQRLWATGIHDSRLLATIIDEPAKITKEQMDSWVKDFDSWDICDGCCIHLFRKTPFAYDKAREWSQREEEFVKRAGFALITTLAVHDKKQTDEEFIKFLPLIKRGASDNRNFVKKAVNWALRQIGKRSLYLHKPALAMAYKIKAMDSASARWIANNAIRELTSEAVQQRLIDTR